MKIAVCINHVPDTASKITISKDLNRVELKGLEYIINPYDEFAIEEAIKTAEILNCETIAISVGKERNKDSLKKALAMGIDKAVYLKCEKEFDSISLAKILTAEIKEQSCKLVFFGKQSIDFSNAITGQLTAEILNYNMLSNVTKFDISENTITAERETEFGKEKVQVNLPLIITAEKGLNTPRYPSLKGIMAAKKKPFEEKTVEEFENISVTEKLQKPSVKSSGKIVEGSDEAIKGLVSYLRSEAQII